jgi:ABC-type polar amino acid transport system ATPase subunit
MIIVTHELGFARSVADRVVFMEEGQIIEEGSPSVILRSPSTKGSNSFWKNLTLPPSNPNQMS